MKKLEGIVAPMATALAPDGHIDEKRTRILVDFLIDGGIDALFPLGTSGEFALLNDEERRTVIRTVVDQTNGRVPVLAGVSDTSLANVVAHAKDAKDSGADPLFVYNIPEWTHLYVPPRVIQLLAEKRVIVGMKYTEYNLLNLLRFIKAAGDRISILTGSDAMAFTSLEFGGNGGVIGVANVAPRLASSVFDEFKSGDFEAARQAQMRLLPVIEAIGIGRFPAGLKEAMRLIGMPVGSVKKPLQSLTIGEKEEVAGFLREAGMLKRGA